jgi:hypothetical protein
MTEIKLVNVFTHMGAGGNPCPIVADASTLQSDDMQAIANHFGHVANALDRRDSILMRSTIRPVVISKPDSSRSRRVTPRTQRQESLLRRSHLGYSRMTSSKLTASALPSCKDGP